MVYFFQAGAPFSIENAKFWLVLVIVGYFVTKLGIFGAPFTGLNSVVVPQNGQLVSCNNDYSTSKRTELSQTPASSQGTKFIHFFSKPTPFVV